MTDTADTQETGVSPSTAAAGAAPFFDAERRATELAVLDALRTVVDPEIGMNVVELALIKQVILGTDESEIKMILTTPFCPYAGSMIQQVKEAYGTIDEAVAALGLARANLAGLPDLAALILRFQRELFVAGAELATNPDAWDRLADDVTRVSAAMVRGVEAVLVDLEARIVMPREFVVPGETVASSALEIARTVLRRAERRAVSLDAAGLVPGAHLVRYLNRLADLLWVLARAAEQAEARTATPARADRSARTGRTTAKK